MINETGVDQQDIKRILIERDVTTLKQAICRIMCTEIRNKDTRIFVLHRWNTNCAPFIFELSD